MARQSQILVSDLYNRLVLKATLKAAGFKRCWVIVFWFFIKIQSAFIIFKPFAGGHFVLLAAEDSPTTGVVVMMQINLGTIRFIRCFIGLCHAVHNDNYDNDKGAASIIWKWGGYKRSDLQQSPIFCKIYKETLPGKDGNKPVPPLKAKTHHWLQPAYWGMWGGDTSSWWLNRQLLEHSLVAIQITKRTNSGDWCGYGGKERL